MTTEKTVDKIIDAHHRHNLGKIDYNVLYINIEDAVEEARREAYAKGKSYRDAIEGSIPQSMIDQQVVLAESEAYKKGYIDGGIAESDAITEDTSDGYHTFKELYEFRLLYNAHLFNEWYAQGKYNVHKSQRHYDGELCFGRDDYFVVVATLPSGQISNHYPMSDWDLFKCEAVEKAKVEWDGHTPQDVAKRLRDELTK